MGNNSLLQPQPVWTTNRSILEVVYYVLGNKSTQRGNKKIIDTSHYLYENWVMVTSTKEPDYVRSKVEKAAGQHKNTTLLLPTRAKMASSLQFNQMLNCRFIVLGCAFKVTSMITSKSSSYNSTKTGLFNQNFNFARVLPQWLLWRLNGLNCIVIMEQKCSSIQTLYFTITRGAYNYCNLYSQIQDTFLPIVTCQPQIKVHLIFEKKNTNNNSQMSYYLLNTSSQSGLLRLTNETANHLQIKQMIIKAVLYFEEMLLKEYVNSYNNGRFTPLEVRGVLQRDSVNLT